MRSWDSLICRSSNSDADAPLSTHRRDGQRKARDDIDGQQNAHIDVDGRQKACNYIDGQLKACNDLNGRQKARNDLDGHQNAHIDVDGRQKTCNYREEEKRRIQFISNAKSVGLTRRHNIIITDISLYLYLSLYYTIVINSLTIV